MEIIDVECILGHKSYFHFLLGVAVPFKIRHILWPGRAKSPTKEWEEPKALRNTKKRQSTQCNSNND